MLAVELQSTQAARAVRASYQVSATVVQSSSSGPGPCKTQTVPGKSDNSLGVTCTKNTLVLVAALSQTLVKLTDQNDTWCSGVAIVWQSGNWLKRESS